MTDATTNLATATDTTAPDKAVALGAVADPAGEPDEPARSPHDTSPVDPASAHAGEPDATAPIAADHSLVPVPAAHRPNLLTRLLAAVWPSAASSLRTDLEAALAAPVPTASAEDGFSPEERALLRNILALREKKVEDVMIPRGEIVAVETTTTLSDALVCFEESGHSRLPVWGETPDDPRGMIHIRDVVDHLVRRSRGRMRKKPANGDAALKPNGAARPSPRLDLSRIDLAKTVGETRLMREVLYVPPSMPAIDLMAMMQARRIQMALVIDEYGGTDGLASLEDVVEVIVGDIEDEHDDEAVKVRQVSPTVWEADGRAELDDLADALGVPLTSDDERDDEIDTLGGLIFVRLGRVPARGEVVQVVRGHEFQVLEADARRIRRVRITKGRPRARTRVRRVEPAGDGKGEEKRDGA